MQVVQLLRETKSIKVGPSFILLVIKNTFYLFLHNLYFIYN